MHDHFGGLYAVVDVDDRKQSYVGPKGISGFGPTPPVYDEAQCVPGSVLVVYVITTEGLVTSLYAVRATNSLLSEIAAHKMSERRFQPAQLEGEPISTVAASRFTFKCPAQPGAVADRPPAVGR
jgi:hypothetical protein